MKMYRTHDLGFTLTQHVGCPRRGALTPPHTINPWLAFNGKSTALVRSFARNGTSEQPSVMVMRTVSEGHACQDLTCRVNSSVRVFHIIYGR